MYGFIRGLWMIPLTVSSYLRFESSLLHFEHFSPWRVLILHPTLIWEATGQPPGASCNVFEKGKESCIRRFYMSFSWLNQPWYVSLEKPVSRTLPPRVLSLSLFIRQSSPPHSKHFLCLTCYVKIYNYISIALSLEHHNNYRM